MNVSIRHNGVNISGFVESYEREHKICTGIGTLTASIVGTISRTFDPWDTIDIHENGDFKVRYYVSSISQSNPKGNIILECQDVSKRLVDYFIPDTYTVDYPSYTRYWIEKFLTEAGVDFEFNTASPGTLLSNFTQLGLVSAYEQIITLLQMSGWYMYFDGNEKAIVGSLNVDFATEIGSLGKTDILDILKVSDDRMLRNRALVLGAYDPYDGGYASADVSVHTPWNYDHRDQRAIVISNSNIPNRGTAYGMANQIIKEFARITVEKHITAWGARNFNLGTALRVTSNVWRGRGLITTFGVTMDKNGLVTKIILDERCPRLFGYFDFGDYVYVGTYGEGVWRKHIKFDHTWHDFSSGLTNLEITDLHINNGVFGSVGSSGQAYYAIDSTPWNEITLSSFMSSVADEVTESGTLELIPFSGLSARATIVDKFGNVLRFGIDNASGINTGDYFITSSGILSSGISASGLHNRGWVVEYDVLSGDLSGTAYPISLSGNYNFFVVDLDNDGKNDFVSVGTGGEGGPPILGEDANYGRHYSQPYGSTKDFNAYSIYPSLESIEDINNGYRGSMEFSGMRVQNANALIAIDDQLSGYTFAVAVGKDNVARKAKFTRVYDSGDDIWDVTVTTTTSSANGSLTGSYILGIYPDLGADTFRVFYTKGPSAGILSFYYLDWNALSNSWGSETLIDTVALEGAGTGYSATMFRQECLVQGTTAYCLFHYLRHASPVGGYYVAPSYLYLNVVHLNMETSSLINDPILEFEAGEFETSGRYYYFNDTADGDPPSEPLGGTGRCTIFHIFQDGSAAKIIGRSELYHYYLPDTVKSTKEYLFAGNVSVVQVDEYYTDTQITGSDIRRYKNLNTNNWIQLTETAGVMVGNSTDVGGDSYAFDGTTFLTYVSTGATLPFHLEPDNIYPMFVNNGNKYVAFDSGTNAFYICSADSLSVGDVITPPTDYYLEGISSNGVGSFSNSVYAVIYDDIEFREFMCPYDFTSFDFSRKIYPNDDGVETVPNFNTRTINFGNFFIEDALEYIVTAQPAAGVYYVDVGQPDWDATTYMVLRRDGTEYTLIQEEAYPIRVDISNNAPVLTVGSGDSSFTSNYVYESELIVIEAAPSGQVQRVDDYRYSYLEPTYSGISASGLGVEATILYVTGSGVYGADALTYSGGFQVLYEVPSGYGTRIETSNFGVGGQYVFVTSSGFVQTFYQKDPDAFGFVEYSGLPQSRATIIRLDDAI